MAYEENNQPDSDGGRNCKEERNANRERNANEKSIDEQEKHQKKTRTGQLT